MSDKIIFQVKNEQSYWLKDINELYQLNDNL